MLKLCRKLEMNTLYYKKKITSSKFYYKNIQTMLKIYVRNHIQNIKKPIRKRKHYYYDDQEESEESDSYVTEIRKICPNKQRKRVIYKDEIDGLREYELHSPTEDEEQEEEQDNYKIQTKSKKEPPKQIEKSKQLRKGITKLIKM